MSKIRIVGWVLCTLLALLLIMSGIGKFMISPEAEEMLKAIGWQPSQMFALGIIELASTLLFIIPTRVSFIGLILLTAYMGGAVATHVRVHESPVFQVLIGVLLWTAYSMAHPEVFLAAFGFKPAPPKTEANA